MITPCAHAILQPTQKLLIPCLSRSLPGLSVGYQECITGCHTTLGHTDSYDPWVWWFPQSSRLSCTHRPICLSAAIPHCRPRANLGAPCSPSCLVKLVIVNKSRRIPTICVFFHVIALTWCIHKPHGIFHSGEPRIWTSFLLLSSAAAPLSSVILSCVVTPWSFFSDFSFLQVVKLYI